MMGGGDNISKQMLKEPTRVSSDLLLRDDDLARGRIVGVRDRVVEKADGTHHLTHLLHTVGHIGRITVHLNKIRD